MSDRSIDLTVVVIYLISITVFGLWIGRKHAKTKEGYFLGDRNFNWILIGFSLFATNISMGFFVGGTGKASKAGFAAFNPELLGGFMLTISAIIFIPMYLRTRIFTIPQFLEMRFNKTSKLLYGGLFSVTQFFSAPLGLYTASTAVLVLFQFEINSTNVVICSLMIACTVGLYAILGGLTSVVVTDFIQVVIMIVGSLIVAIIAVHQVGGLDALFASVDKDMLTLLRPASDKEFPWTAAFPGQSLHSAFYAFCSIAILQRALGAKNVDHAQKGLLLGGFLKIFGLVLFVIPGIAGSLLFPEIPGDTIYATMVRDFLPAGISGLILAGMLAALMSSQDSSINATAGVVALDIYPVFKPQASEREAVIVGKVFAATQISFGVIAAPVFLVIEQGIFDLVLKISGFMLLPAGVCYLWGRLVPRVNGAGASATLLCGLVLGVYYILTSSLPGLRSFLPEFVHEAHYYHVYPVFVLILTGIFFAVSFMTDAPTPDKLEFLKAHADDRAHLKSEQPWYRKFYFWWGVYVVVVLGLYIVF